MILKRVMLVIMAVICSFSTLCCFAYADEFDSFEEDEIVPAYEIASDIVSSLMISGNTATCTSSASGTDCVSISVTHTLQKRGFLWIWDDVDSATWSKTINTNTICLTSTKSGLSSGKYRLKSIFALTNSNGEIETITIYSEEKTVG